MRIIKENRKLHDKWSLVFYLILTITATTFEICEIDYKRARNVINFSIIGNYSFFFAIFSLSNIVTFLLLPRFTLHLQGVAYPAITIFLGLKTEVNVLIGLSCVVAIFEFFMYILYIKDKIVYIAPIIECSTEIILKNFLALLPIFFTLFSIILGQSILIFLIPIEKMNWTSIVCYVISYINGFWTIQIITYLLNVLISGIIGQTFIRKYNDDNTQIFLPSFKAAVYSIGSVCLCSLISMYIAAVNLLIKIEIDSENPYRKRIRENFFSLFISIIFKNYDDYILFYNDITLPYIAYNGEDYNTAMKKTHSIMRNKNNTPVTFPQAFKMPYIFGITFFSAICIGYILYNNVWFLKTPRLIIPESLSLDFSITFFYITLYILFINTFYSGCYAIVYFHHEMNNVVETVAPNVSLVLDENVHVLLSKFYSDLK